MKMINIILFSLLINISFMSNEKINNKFLIALKSFIFHRIQVLLIQYTYTANTLKTINRLYNKTQNVRESLSNQHDALERVLLFSGWSKWNLGVEDVGKSKKKQKFGTKKRKVYKRTR